MTKTETSVVERLDIVIIVAQRDHRLPTHMPLVNYIVNDGLLSRNMEKNPASVHDTYLDKIVCYTQRIFNRNPKLKQQASK